MTEHAIPDPFAAPADTRTAVMVLGMHRSGTSAVSRFFSLLGCDLPASLLGAGPGNDLGHWESQAIWHFNDELLASGGSRWDDWLEFAPQWYGSAQYEGFVERGGDLLHQEFGASPLFVMKDPRNCRLFPFWREVLRRQNIRPVVVIALRYPGEVALSLVARDRSDAAYAQQMWLRHLLDADFHSRGLPRVVASYDRLLDDWPALAQQTELAFGFAWPRASLADSDIAEFLTEELRHHRLAVEDQSLSGWLGTVYRILHRWAQDGEDANDHRQLDEIRSELDRATPNFAPLAISVLDKTRLIQQLDAQASVQAEAVAALTHARDALAGEVQANAQHIATLQLQLARSRQEAEDRIAAVTAELQEQAAEIAALSLARGTLAGELEKSEQQASALRMELLQSRQEAEERIAAITAKLQRERAEEVAALSLARDALSGELRAAEEQTSVVRLELAQLRQDAADQVAAVTAELHGEREGHHQLRAAQAGQLLQIDELTSRLAQAADALDLSDEKYRQTASRAESLDISLGEARRRIMELERSMNTAVIELRHRVKKIATLAAEVRQQAESTTTATRQTEWLSQVLMLISSNPGWWAMMPESWRQRRIYQLLQRKRLFDSQGYLTRHADVAEQKMDPLRHYILHGMAEGRSR